MSSISEKPIETIHIVGGGSQNEMLNQMTANATGAPVKAGPVEATVIGNALVQLISLGEIADLEDGRKLVSKLEDIIEYEPQDKSAWDEAYERYTKL